MSLRKVGTNAPNDAVLRLRWYIRNHTRANFRSLISSVAMYRQVKYVPPLHQVPTRLRTCRGKYLRSRFSFMRTRASRYSIFPEHIRIYKGTKAWFLKRVSLSSYPTAAI